MNVFVRTDASARIGTGHLMRCFALGQALRRHGATVTFLVREIPAVMATMLESHGIELCRLPEGLAEREGCLSVSWETDAQQAAAILAQRGNVDWLVVDHYGIDYRWEERVRTPGCRTLVIDDLARHRHSCDVLLNQNLIADADARYRPLVPPGCKLLAGPRFALLREEFRTARDSLRRNLEHASNLLVFLGGADAEGASLKVLEVVDRVRPRELRVTAVIGAANPHRSTVERLCAQRDGFRAIFQSANMAQLMADADVAIGAGGVSTWERCCLGLPAMVIAIAENQLEVGKAAAEAGACLFLGPFAGMQDEDLAASLRLMIGNASLRKAISEAGLKLVDGLGCQRVAKAMLQRPLQIRLARAEDAERLFEWRNAEETRRHSHDPGPLTREGHLQWLRQSLADANRVLLIGESDTGPVGVLRYDIEQDAATVSIYLDPRQHGRGYGPSLLSSGERWLQQSRPAIKRVRAEIGLENHGSRSAFMSAGFHTRGLLLEKSLELGPARMPERSP